MSLAFPDPPSIQPKPRQPAAVVSHRRAVGAALVAAALVAVFAAIALLMVGGTSEAAEVALMRDVGATRSPALTAVMKLFSLIGSGKVEIPFGLAMFGFILWRLRRPSAAWFYFVAVLSGEVVYAVAKAVFQRPRPDVLSKLDAAGWYSFPSGHAMLGPLVFGLAALILMQHVRSPWGRALLFLAASVVVVGIAGSRVYLGVHYPTDVVAGVFLGTAWGALWIAIWENARLRQLRSGTA